jgi:hypothetical protein
VSHNPERKEKDCLNCGTIVNGRFCHVCGQENIVTRESFWSMSKHFVYDILHFDGNFFHTVKYIFIKPGYVARQYAEGKRMRYLHPIRMYLFTSAVFFLIFFSVNSYKPGNNTLKSESDNEDRVELAQDYKEQLHNNPADSFLLPRIALLLDTIKPLNIDSLNWKKKSGLSYSFDGKNYASVAEYDSMQSLLPPDKKDNWIEKQFIRQSIKTTKKYGNEEGLKSINEIFLHKLPYLLFLSLPFFALILKLIYVRRKNFFYSDHAIFTLYHYILSFLLLLIFFGINALQSTLQWKIFSYLKIMLVIAWPVYLFIEMRQFYRQSIGKTLSKFLLLNLLGLITMIILLLFFLLFSFFQL